MAIEVLIRRKVMESKAKEVSPLIVKLRSLATIQPGYINDQIDQLSRGKAEYAIYEPLVGGIIPASNIQGEK
jgi:hypothetical protein